jgi:hypothetical protein
MVEFKIRASGCSKIMGIKGLGLTGQTFLIQSLKEMMFKRRSEIKSKYITKGNLSEEDGFTLMALELDLGMVFKNVSFFENDFICGTPDLIIGDTVYDNKCSWSLDTFPLFESEIPNKDYWWQLQCYMELTGCRKAVLAYTLIDAPLELVEQAIKWETNQDATYRKVNEMVYTKKYFDELKERFFSLSTLDFFVEIPANKRIKKFAFDYDQKAIELVKERVLESRKYINSLLNNNK